MGSMIFCEGLIYSLVLGAIITGSQLANARLWLNCYPDAIQKKVPRRTRQENVAKMIVGVPFLMVMVGYPIYSTFLFKNSIGEEYTFWQGFVNTLILTNFFNLFDLLILDWLVFCRINPDYLILEGTGGMKEYRDYRFHFVGAIKGFAFSIVFSTLIATITLIF